MPTQRFNVLQSLAMATYTVGGALPRAILNWTQIWANTSLSHGHPRTRRLPPDEIIHTPLYIPFLSRFLSTNLSINELCEQSLLRMIYVNVHTRRSDVVNTLRTSKTPYQSWELSWNTPTSSSRRRRGTRDCDYCSLQRCSFYTHLVLLSLPRIMKHRVFW